MRIFDTKGMMVIPNPAPKEAVRSRNVLVVQATYCPNGHNLISSRVMFNNLPGILLKASTRNETGLIALSPIYGQHIRVSQEISLTDGEVVELSCPTCGVPLPTHSPCSCGANLKTCFLTQNVDFTNCIGICNRVGCPNSRIIESGDLITLAMVDVL